MSYKRYQLENTGLGKLNIHLLYITQARYEIDWHSVLHSHHFTELFYVVSGTGNFIVEEDAFSVKKDDLIIINPNVSHTEFGDNQAHLEYIVIGVDGLQFEPEGSDRQYNYSHRNFQNHSSDISFYLKMMVQEVKKKEENYETICQNLLESLILYLIRKTKDNVTYAPTNKMTKECRFVEQYLDEHFSEDISLQTLSEMTYMNKYYLVHVFKNYKGKSPISYLIERRIVEAKSLLESSNYSVAKIAHAVGFSSQSYFSQVFRKETNMTPNQYRKSTELHSN
ncbi:MAG: AraC family transcriptional regulator [Lachnospiraceae bacterium]